MESSLSKSPTSNWHVRDGVTHVLWNIGLTNAMLCANIGTTHHHTAWRTDQRDSSAKSVDSQIGTMDSMEARSIRIGQQLRNSHLLRGDAIWLLFQYEVKQSCKGRGPYVVYDRSYVVVFIVMIIAFTVCISRNQGNHKGFLNHVAATEPSHISSLLAVGSRSDTEHVTAVDASSQLTLFASRLWAQVAIRRSAGVLLRTSVRLSVS